MPDPLSILNFIIVSIMCTAIAFVLSWRKESNLFYKVALGNVYIGEIAIAFLFFVLYVDSSVSPFTYDEKSNLKVFLDFFTIYQITVLLFFKTLDGITERPFHTYLFELKRIDLGLARQDFKYLINEFEKISIKRPRYYYHDFLHLSRELLSLKLFFLIAKGVSDPIQTKRFEAIRKVSVKDMRARFTEKGETEYEEELNDLRKFIENEITQVELWLEENKDPWSGSIALRIAYTNKISTRFKKIRKFIQQYQSSLIFIIINLMIMLILILSYLNLNVNISLSIMLEYYYRIVMLF